MKQKVILDACCGGRMFWFDKAHPRVLYVDIRAEEKGFMKVRHSYGKSGKRGVIEMRYGRLFPETWEINLELGFKECWRVLDDYGVLIFKWNSKEKKIADILKLFSAPPLFGHTTNNKGNTHWMTFMKIPNE